ncbi:MULTISPECIES: helix-turn-helix transcriptional regulator [unclassified Streptomyces]|uniref:helix-turn-helix domain-containing protein n=1 Tax=unclassified Streptomyces TaxID=2593676 RepID=UPI001EFCB846|nr:MULTISPECIES: helix-turn-helix transcriptional regulator [unclassified Streptomyces]
MPSIDTFAMELYGWILDNTQTDLDRAAQALGISREQTEAKFYQLARLGVVRVDEEDERLVSAVDPDAAALRYTRPVRETIKREQERLDGLMNDYGLLRSRFLQARGGGECMVEVIPRLDEVRAALNRASAECREEMLAMQPGGNRVPEALEEAVARDHAMLSRGVRMRAIYHHTSRFNGPSQVYVARASALGAEYRTVHELVNRMIIFDRDRLAFIPLRDDENAAVAIREPSIVAFLHRLFEHVWAHADAFSPASSDQLEEVSQELDRTIVQLLAGGLKDETIARRLGMSLRTTRRHIADIMKRLGAESRFQAGVLIARAEAGGHRDDALSWPAEPTAVLREPALRPVGN